MDNISIVLPNEKSGTYKIVTILIAIINATALVYFAFKSAENSSMHDLSVIASAMVMPPLLIFIFLKKWLYSKVEFVIISLFLAAIFWILIGFYLIGFLLFLFAFSGVIAMRKLKIDFNDFFISYPSFPRKKIQWNEVSNLILKDNVITIDLKNNTLLQYALNKSENENLDEALFNHYIQQRINLASEEKNNNS